MLPLTSNSSATLTPARSLRKSVIGRADAAVEDLEIARRQVLNETALVIADDGAMRTRSTLDLNVATGAAGAGGARGRLTMRLHAATGDQCRQHQRSIMSLLCVVSNMVDDLRLASRIDRMQLGVATVRPRIFDTV